VGTERSGAKEKGLTEPNRKPQVAHLNLVSVFGKVHPLARPHPLHWRLAFALHTQYTQGLTAVARFASTGRHRLPLSTNMYCCDFHFCGIGIYPSNSNATGE
jgi:hypothetical protein